MMMISLPSAVILFIWPLALALPQPEMSDMGVLLDCSHSEVIDRKPQADPTSMCTDRFYMCVDMAPQLLVCGQGLKFNGTNCVPEAQVEDCKTDATISTGIMHGFTCPSERSGVYRDQVNPCNPMYWKCVAGKVFRYECDPGYIVEVDRSSPGFGLCRHAVPAVDCPSTVTLPPPQSQQPAATNTSSPDDLNSGAELLGDTPSAPTPSIDQRNGVKLPKNASPDMNQMIMPNVCALLDDGTHVLKECNRDFVICKSGMVRFKFYCDIGFVMNVTSRTCMEASDECKARMGGMDEAESRCVGMTDGVYSSGPCSPAFYICEKGLVYYQASCGEGKTKNLSTSKCEAQANICIAKNRSADLSPSEPTSESGLDGKNQSKGMNGMSPTADDQQGKSKMTKFHFNLIPSELLNAVHDCSKLSDGKYPMSLCSNSILNCAGGKLVKTETCETKDRTYSPEAGQCVQMPEFCGQLTSGKFNMQQSASDSAQQSGVGDVVVSDEPNFNEPEKETTDAAVVSGQGSKPVVPEENSKPVVPEGSKPVVPEDSNPVVPEESSKSVVPEESSKPVVPEDSKPVMSEESAEPVVPEESAELVVPAGEIPSNTNEVDPAACKERPDGKYALNDCLPTVLHCRDGAVYTLSFCSTGYAYDPEAGDCAPISKSCQNGSKLELMSDDEILEEDTDMTPVNRTIAAAEMTLNCTSMPDGPHADQMCSQLIHFCMNGSMIQKYTIKCAPGNSLVLGECQPVPESCLMKNNDKDVDAIEDDQIPGTGQLIVTIKMLTGRQSDIVISPDDTIQNMKGSIRDVEGVPPSQQRLIFNG